MIYKEQYFPTTFYTKDLQLDNKFLEQNILEWQKQDPEGLKKTNMYGWHSQSNMHTKPEYKPVVDELIKMQLEIYKEEYLDREPVLGNMWANINYTGSYNQSHIHPNSLFSGSYYVKTPPNCGDLVATDPRPGVQNCLPARKQGQLPLNIWRDVYFKAHAGRAMMFPAWVWHRVEPNNSNETRISIGFNFIQKGF